MHRSRWILIPLTAVVAATCGACGGDARPAADDTGRPVLSPSRTPPPRDALPGGDTAPASRGDTAEPETGSAAATLTDAAAPPSPESQSAGLQPRARAAAPTADPPVAPAPAETVVAPLPASSGESSDRPNPSRAEPAAIAHPFPVGERLSYEVRFGPVAVGTATMHVVGITDVRGIPAYHTRFEVRGGNRLYRVHDRYESWFDTRSLASLRYIQEIDQGSYERRSVFEIYPDQQRFIEQGKEPQRTVEQPLDEGSFLYWLRTIPLEVGRTYTFNRYFRPDRNPVRIEVLRRERIRVPAGSFDAIVVRPVIQTRGIFSEGGRAEIWFADDSTRRMLQMKSRLSFGSLNLYLKN